MSILDSKIDVNDKLYYEIVKLDNDRFPFYFKAEEIFVPEIVEEAKLMLSEQGDYVNFNYYATQYGDPNIKSEKRQPVSWGEGMLIMACVYIIVTTRIEYTTELDFSTPIWNRYTKATNRDGLKRITIAQHPKFSYAVLNFMFDGMYIDLKDVDYFGFGESFYMNKNIIYYK